MPNTNLKINISTEYIAYIVFAIIGVIILYLAFKYLTAQHTIFL